MQLNKSGRIGGDLLAGKPKAIDRVGER